MKTNDKLQNFVLGELYNDLHEKNEQKLQGYNDNVLCSHFFEGCPIDIYAQFAVKAVNLINENTLIGIEKLDYNVWVMVSNVIYESLYAGMADEHRSAALYLYALKGDKNYKDLKYWFLKNSDDWISMILGDFDLLEDSQWLHWLDISDSIGWNTPTSLPVLAYLSNIERHIPSCDDKLYEKAMAEYEQLNKSGVDVIGTKPSNYEKPADIEEPGNVYLMINNINKRIKIGKTTEENPRYRERTLQSQEPDVTLLFHRKVLYMSKTERFLHSVFKDSRFRGEWFDLSMEQIKEAKDMMTNAVNKPIHQPNQ